MSAPSQRNFESYPAGRTAAQWQSMLTQKHYNIFTGGTEYPGQGQYQDDFPSKGHYACAACDTPLYKASHKMKHYCGWAAFGDSLKSVEQEPDPDGTRTEILCSRCGGHLGHVFFGEPGLPGGVKTRHCVNGIRLQYKEEGGAEDAPGQGPAS